MNRFILTAFFFITYPLFRLMRWAERAEERGRRNMFEAAQKLRRSQERRALDIQRVRVKLERGR